MTWCLVDLGALDDRTASGAFARGLGSCLDAVVLVTQCPLHDSQPALELQRWLATAGVRRLGVIQNFVGG